jgi:hypothetical protein
VPAAGSLPLASSCAPDLIIQSTPRQIQGYPRPPKRMSHIQLYITASTPVSCADPQSLITRRLHGASGHLHASLLVRTRQPYGRRHSVQHGDGLQTVGCCTVGAHCCMHNRGAQDTDGADQRQQGMRATTLERLQCSSHAEKESAHAAHVCMSQTVIAMAPPFGFGADGHVELGISDFQVWQRAGQGLPDPDVNRMGFFITPTEPQTLPEFDRSKVKLYAKHCNSSSLPYASFCTCNLLLTSAASHLICCRMVQGECPLDAENLVKLFTMDVVDQYTSEEHVYRVALQVIFNRVTLLSTSGQRSRQPVHAAAAQQGRSQ